MYACAHVGLYVPPAWVQSCVESAPTSVNGFAVQRIVLVWFVASDAKIHVAANATTGAATLKTTTRGTLSMTSRVCQASNSTSPKRGGSSGCAGTSSWQKNIHTPTHVGQSMESRRGRSMDPRRDREHVSNTNSEGTYCRDEPLHL